MAKNQTLLMSLGAAAVAALVILPFNTVLLVAVVAGVAYAATGGLLIPLIVVGLAVVARLLQNSLPYFNGFFGKPPAPAPRAEAFAYPKDPLSVHQRITKHKREEPLAPKVGNVVGVLEQRQLLDNLQIAALSPEEQGAPASTVPAGTRERPTVIPTPPEGFISPRESVKREPFQNPSLITGEDPTGVSTALTTRGSSLVPDVSAGNVGSTTTGPAPAGYA